MGALNTAYPSQVSEGMVLTRDAQYCSTPSPPEPELWARWYMIVVMTTGGAVILLAGGAMAWRAYTHKSDDKEASGRLIQVVKSPIAGKYRKDLEPSEDDRGGAVDLRQDSTWRDTMHRERRRCDTVLAKLEKELKEVQGEKNALDGMAEGQEKQVETIVSGRFLGLDS